MRRCCMRRVLRALFIGVFGPFAATAAQTVRDSAGIRIIENRAPVLSPARAWTIDPQSVVVIGSDAADTDSLNELQLIMGITRLSDGRFAVGVQASNAVRFYDAKGRFVGFAGRKGRGPGEFRQIMGVWAIRGDTLVVLDLGEIEIFTGDGKFVGQGASRARGDRFVYPSAVLSDGSYLGVLFDDRTVPPAGRMRKTSPVVHVSRDGTRADTGGTFLSAEEVYDGRQPFGSRVAFSGTSSLAGDDSRLFISSPLKTEVRQMTLGGKLTRLIRLPERTVRTSDEAIQAYRAWFLSMPGEDGRPMSPEMKARFAQILERTEFAERLPPFGQMIIDKVGNLWIQQFSYQSVFYTPGPVRTRTMTVPSRWDVIDPSGRWSCTVELPARFTPVDIGNDYVAGLGRDEDEVEQVRIYRLLKGGSP